MRRQLDKDLSTKLEKANRAAKQLMTLSIKARAEVNQKARDEKIKMIKINLQREAAIGQERELQRIHKEEEALAKRIAEIEQKRYQDIKKKEMEYRAKREAIIKYASLKEASESEMCKEYLRILESKIAKCEEKAKGFMVEKVQRIQGHNHDVVEKKQ